MLRLLTGRALAQWRLLATLLAVVTVGATLLGTCALLVTRTADRALEVAASRATTADRAVTAYTVTVAGGDAASVPPTPVTCCPRRSGRSRPGPPDVPRR